MLATQFPSKLVHEHGKAFVGKKHTILGKNIICVPYANSGRNTCNIFINIELKLMSMSKKTMQLQTLHIRKPVSNPKGANNAGHIFTLL
jgi:hypothetical protein